VFNTPVLRVDQFTTTTTTKSGYCNATEALLQAEAPIINISNHRWIETYHKAIHPDTGEAVEYKHLQANVGQRRS
jgi:hypothetical protein